MEGEENGGRRKGKMEEGEDGVRSEWREGSVEEGWNKGRRELGEEEVEN